MQVKTKSLGEVEVQESQVVTIPDGLIGFEAYKNFVLIESSYKPFIWLQSVEEQNLAFLLIDPFLICDNYEADIDDATLAKIGVNDPSDVVVMVTITIPAVGSPITANLQGPLVINKKNNTCLQAILDGTKWTTKHNIAEALKKKEGK